jgi:3-hydroxyisobutyrate dehydrogenase-like beta-hydroxyacid dehydrogenase
MGLFHRIDCDAIQQMYLVSPAALWSEAFSMVQQRSVYTEASRQAMTGGQASYWRFGFGRIENALHTSSTTSNA